MTTTYELGDIVEVIGRDTPFEPGDLCLVMDSDSDSTLTVTPLGAADRPVVIVPRLWVIATTSVRLYSDPGPASLSSQIGAVR